MEGREAAVDGGAVKRWVGGFGVEGLLTIRGQMAWIFRGLGSQVGWSDGWGFEDLVKSRETPIASFKVLKKSRIDRSTNG